MTSIPSPYEAVIADLKQQRDKIDQTITALEILSGGTGGAIQTTQPTNAGGVDATEGAFLGMSIAEASKALLLLHKKVLGNAEIVNGLEAGGLVLKPGNKINTVGSILNRRFNKIGDIVSVSRGKWGLKEWYPNKRFDRKGNDNDPKGDKPDDLKPDAVMSDSSDPSEHEQP